MVDFGVPVDLNCYIQASLMILATDYLCKASFPQDFQDLKSVVDLVSCLNNVVSFFIITVFLAFGLATNSSSWDVSCEIDNVFTFLPEFRVFKFFLLGPSSESRCLERTPERLQFSVCEAQDQANPRAELRPRFIEFIYEVGVGSDARPYIIYV